MIEELKQWENHIQTVGTFWSGVKADELEQLLNKWGAEGWKLYAIISLRMQTR